MQTWKVVNFDEDVGSVELCVTYRGDNVPQSIGGTIKNYEFGRQHKIYYCAMFVCLHYITLLCVH